MSFSLSYKKVIEVLEKNGLLSATNAEPSGSVHFTSISYDSRYVDSDTFSSARASILRKTIISRQKIMGSELTSLKGSMTLILFFFRYQM